MITDALLNIASAALRALLGLIPDWEIHSFDLATLAEITGRTGMLFNEYVPIPLIITCMLILLTTSLALSAWTAVVWIYHQIWGSN